MRETFHMVKAFYLALLKFMLLFRYFLHFPQVGTIMITPKLVGKIDTIKTYYSWNYNVQKINYYYGALKKLQLSSHWACFQFIQCCVKE